MGRLASRRLLHERERVLRAQLRLEALTLYAFSVDNWKRPRHEIEGLWRLLGYYLRRELSNLMQNNIQLMAIGRLESLPSVVQDELQNVVDKTAKNRGMRLNLAINRLVQRRAPVFSFLSRRHPLNRQIGRIRHRTMEMFGGSSQ